MDSNFVQKYIGKICEHALRRDTYHLRTPVHSMCFQNNKLGFLVLVLVLSRSRRKSPCSTSLHIFKLFSRLLIHNDCCFILVFVGFKSCA